MYLVYEQCHAPGLTEVGDSEQLGRATSTPTRGIGGAAQEIHGDCVRGEGGVESLEVEVVNGRSASRASGASTIWRPASSIQEERR